MYAFTFRSNSSERLTILPSTMKFSSVINHTGQSTEIAYILAEVILRIVLNSTYCQSVTP
jgi:2-polyprenyl-3-methyl-5-hydroxy-6-metoxy-1,4-benzoquinol methylase